MKSLLMFLVILNSFNAQASGPLLQGQPYSVIEAAFQNAAPTNLKKAVPLCMTRKGVYKDSGLRFAVSSGSNTDIDITPKTRSLAVNSELFFCRVDLDIMVSEAVPNSGSLFPGKPAVIESLVSLGLFRVDVNGKSSPATTAKVNKISQQFLLGGYKQKIYYHPDLVIDIIRPADEQRKFCAGQIAIQRETYRTFNKEYIIKVEYICPSDSSQNRVGGYNYYGRW